MLKTHDLSFASRPYNFVVNVICYDRTDVAFCPYGEYWRQMRKICSLELFSVKRVESFRSIREEEVFGLVRWIGERENCPINLTGNLVIQDFKFYNTFSFKLNSIYFYYENII